MSKSIEFSSTTSVNAEMMTGVDKFSKSIDGDNNHHRTSSSVVEDGKSKNRSGESLLSRSSPQCLEQQQQQRQVEGGVPIEKEKTVVDVITAKEKVKNDSVDQQVEDNGNNDKRDISPCEKHDSVDAEKETIEQHIDIENGGDEARFDDDEEIENDDDDDGDDTDDDDDDGSEDFEDEYFEKEQSADLDKRREGKKKIKRKEDDDSNNDDLQYMKSSGVDWEWMDAIEPPPGANLQVTSRLADYENWLPADFVQEIRQHDPTPSDIDPGTGMVDTDALAAAAKQVFYPGRIFYNIYQLKQAAMVFSGAWGFHVAGSHNKVRCFYSNTGQIRDGKYVQKHKPKTCDRRPRKNPSYKIVDCPFEITVRRCSAGQQHQAGMKAKIKFGSCFQHTCRPGPESQQNARRSSGFYVRTEKIPGMLQSVPFLTPEGPKAHHEPVKFLAIAAHNARFLGTDDSIPVDVRAASLGGTGDNGTDTGIMQDNDEVIVDSTAATAKQPADTVSVVTKEMLMQAISNLADLVVPKATNPADIASADVDVDDNQHNLAEVMWHKLKEMAQTARSLPTENSDTRFLQAWGVARPPSATKCYEVSSTPTRGNAPVGADVDGNHESIPDDSDDPRLGDQQDELDDDNDNEYDEQDEDEIEGLAAAVPVTAAAAYDRSSAVSSGRKRRRKSHILHGVLASSSQREV